MNLFYKLGLISSLVALAALICANQCVAGAYDFSIKAVDISKLCVRVRTQGAIFEISGNKVKGYQLLGKRRLVAIISLPLKTAEKWRMAAAASSNYEVKFGSASGVELTVTGDSVIRIRNVGSLAVSAAPGFDADYRESSEASAVFADEYGGAGIYGPKGARIELSGMDGGKWKVKYPQLANDPFLAGKCDILVSVFPPRPFNWDQARRDVIVHYYPPWISGTTCQSDFPYPTDKELADWRKIGNVLVLHAECWSSFGTGNIQPKDPKRFVEVIQKAHQLGWRVIVYASPFYFRGDKSKYEAEIRHILSFCIDGMYWDYIAVGVQDAWEIGRTARKLVGNGLLYFHLTQTPFMNKRMLVPFVDAYADYILRGENISWREMDAAYLRYQVSSYNLGNSIGTLCYDTCRINPSVIKAITAVNARLSYWVGGQHNTDNGKNYFLSPDESKLFMREYLPLLPVLSPKMESSHIAARRHDVRLRYKDRAGMRKNLREYLNIRKKQTAASAAVNLAAFKPVCASDVSGNDVGPHGLGPVPQYANDCNANTYWAADLGPQWLEVDLRKVERIGRVKVINFSCGDGRFYQYRILVSNNRVNWIEVAKNLDSKIATAQGNSFSFAPVSARYVRVIMLANSANPGLHISEIGIYR